MLLAKLQCLAFFIFITGSLQLQHVYARLPVKPAEETESREPSSCPYSSPSTNQQDKQALEDVYYSMGGVVWVKSDGWMRGDPCGDNWFGICCSESGRVTELKLPSNLVLGQMAPSVTNLSDLEVLMLFNNSIEGALPPELFAMKKLRMIDLSSNRLSAGIPDVISLPQLVNLTLANNRFQGYLPSKWNTPNLQCILLFSNSFQGSLPSDLGRLTKLVEMDISANFLSGLTGALGKLKSLQRLYLHNNQFHGVEIPDAWSSMSGLRDIQMNFMSGSLPKWIGIGWSEIVKIDLSFGQISGTLPASFCKFKAVNFIDLSTNEITGNIPQCICDLPSKTLTTLHIRDNQLIGTIPDCFDRLLNLTSLSFAGNLLTGNLPRSLGSLPVLQSIVLNNNRLYGLIPTEYAKLSDSIHTFEIMRNKLNSIEDNLEQFFKNTGGFCFVNSNPWTCPLPTYFTSACNVECSKCNTPDKHDSCSACVADSQCGFCEEGGNCLPGSIAGPQLYTCNNESWIYNFQAGCKS